VWVHLIALRQIGTVACSRNASKPIRAFSAASIFGLVLFVIIRSVYHDGTARSKLSPWSQIPGPLHLW
jgi:hypothetical protein